MCPTLLCLTLSPYPSKILLNKCSAPPTPSVSMRLPSVNRVACSCGSRSHLQEQNFSMYFCNFGGSLSLNHLNIRQTRADWGIRFNLSSFSIITQFWGYFLQPYCFYTKVYMNCTKFLLIILSRNLTHYLFSLSYLFFFSAAWSIWILTPVEMSSKSCCGSTLASLSSHTALHTCCQNQ